MCTHSATRGRRWTSLRVTTQPLQPALLVQPGRNMIMFMKNREPFPPALDEALVGTYPALAKSGGGYVWYAVLAYRLWWHPDPPAPALKHGTTYSQPFPTSE